MALIIADNNELLQTVHLAQPLCQRLQPTDSHISRYKVWIKSYIFIQNRDNWWKWGVNIHIYFISQIQNTLVQLNIKFIS